MDHWLWELHKSEVRKTRFLSKKNYMEKRNSRNCIEGYSFERYNREYPLGHICIIASQSHLSERKIKHACLAYVTYVKLYILHIQKNTKNVVCEEPSLTEGSDWGKLVIKMYTYICEGITEFLLFVWRSRIFHFGYDLNNNLFDF